MMAQGQPQMLMQNQMIQYGMHPQMMMQGANGVVFPVMQQDQWHMQPPPPPPRDTHPAGPSGFATFRSDAAGQEQMQAAEGVSAAAAMAKEKMVRRAVRAVRAVKAVGERMLQKRMQKRMPHRRMAARRAMQAMWGRVLTTTRGRSVWCHRAYSTDGT